MSGDAAFPLKLKLLLVGTPLAIALLSVIVWFADPFDVQVVMAISVMQAIPSLIAGIIWLLVAKVKKLSLRQPVILLIGMTVIPLTAWQIKTANHWVHEQATEEAKAYPKQITPFLEEYKQLHGIYPKNLEELPSHPPLPRLLRNPYGYRSDGLRYSFSFDQPGGLIDTWNYSSADQSWYLST